LKPLTGRTHQLRVHLTSIGHPLLGDPTYGGRKVREVGAVTVPRVMLHARTLGFTHPITGQALAFSTPLPPDMAAVIQSLRETTSARSRGVA
jgi:23S rRNA pseudouridine1911/1915/1917 synthase